MWSGGSQPAALLRCYWSSFCFDSSLHLIYKFKLGVCHLSLDKTPIVCKVLCRTWQIYKSRSVIGVSLKLQWRISTNWLTLWQRTSAFVSMCRTKLSAHTTSINCGSTPNCGNCSRRPVEVETLPRNTLMREIGAVKRSYSEMLKSKFSAWLDEDVWRGCVPVLSEAEDQEDSRTWRCVPSCLRTCADQLALIFMQLFNRSLELC